MTNNIKPDKPFKTYDEQIEILLGRKLVITDKEFAIHALKTFSYYDLINGYKEVFTDGDDFIPDISIEYLYLFAQFDKSLQNILFQYSVIIENMFKSALAYVISKKYGVFVNDYLSINNYNVNNKNRDKLSKLLKDIVKLSNSPYVGQPTKHYRDTKNHIPSWILFKNVTFDDITKLYKYLKTEDKNSVSDLFIDLNISNDRKLEFITTSINLIRRCRNKIAHNLKFITYKDFRYKITKSNLNGDQHQSLFDEKSYNNIYGMIICINSILRNDYLKFDMNVSIDNLIKIYSEIDKNIPNDYFKITKIPQDYIERINIIMNQSNI